MKIVVFGSRDFSSFDLLAKKLEYFLQNIQNPVILSGRARGADCLGEEYARRNSIPVELFPAEWEKYGKKAGFFRNKQMFDAADAGVAFWDGFSRGTKNMIDLFLQSGKPLRIVRF